CRASSGSEYARQASASDMGNSLRSPRPELMSARRAFYHSKLENPSTEGRRANDARRSRAQRPKKGVGRLAAGVTPPMAAKLTTLSAFAAAALTLVIAPTALAVPNNPLPTPTPLSPATGAVVDAVPPFAWNPVSVADHYEFQLAADAGFNSPVLGRGSDDFTTQNARATLLKTIPNGKYWWRVRAVGSNGSVSP